MGMCAATKMEPTSLNVSKPFGVNVITDAGAVVFFDDSNDQNEAKTKTDVSKPFNVSVNSFNHHRRALMVN